MFRESQENGRFLSLLVYFSLKVYPVIWILHKMFLLSYSLDVHFGIWDNFWKTESPLKLIKNAFYFILKATFFLEVFKFFSWLFGYEEKRLDKKAKINFETYDVTDWTTNNYNTVLPNISRTKAN